MIPQWCIGRPKGPRTLYVHVQRGKWAEPSPKIPTITAIKIAWAQCLWNFIGDEWKRREDIYKYIRIFKSKEGGGSPPWISGCYPLGCRTICILHSIWLQTHLFLGFLIPQRVIGSTSGWVTTCEEMLNCSLGELPLCSGSQYVDRDDVNSIWMHSSQNSMTNRQRFLDTIS